MCYGHKVFINTKKSIYKVVIMVLRMRMVAFSIRYILISGARRLCCAFFTLQEMETEMFRGKFFLVLAITHHLFDSLLVVIYEVVNG